MANVAYSKFHEGLLDGTINLSTATVKASLIRGYAFDSTHSTVADVVSAGGTLVATTAALTSKTFTLGVFDAADTTFGAVPAGADILALIVYTSTGSNSTSRLIFYADDYPGLPLTPDGTDQPMNWAASGIFALSSL